MTRGHSRARFRAYCKKTDQAERLKPTRKKSARPRRTHFIRGVALETTVNVSFALNLHCRGLKMPEELKYHYSNPKFKGKPWPSDGVKKNKKKNKNKQKKRQRRARILAKQILQPELQRCAKRCEEYLPEFWRKFGSATCEERMVLLKQAANPPWVRVSHAASRQLRKQFVNMGWKYLHLSIAETCATCNNPPQERHHVIPVCFGGIATALNLILICNACHDEIHPWMKSRD